MGTQIPPRSQTVSAIGRKHRGVGLVTNAPIRALTTSWSSDFKAENRVHASSFQTDHRTLAGGVIYGHNFPRCIHQTLDLTPINIWSDGVMFHFGIEMPGAFTA